MDNLNLSSNCRLCINTCRSPQSLYDENGKANETYDLVTKYFYSMFMKLKWGQHMKYICTECYNSLSEFNQFHQIVLESQRRLAQFYKSSQSPHSGSTTSQEPLEINNPVQATMASGVSNQARTHIRRSSTSNQFTNVPGTKTPPSGSTTSQEPLEINNPVQATMASGVRNKVRTHIRSSSTSNQFANIPETSSFNKQRSETAKTPPAIMPSTSDSQDVLSKSATTSAFTTPSRDPENEDIRFHDIGGSNFPTSVSSMTILGSPLEQQESNTHNLPTTLSQDLSIVNAMTYVNQTQSSYATCNQKYSRNCGSEASQQREQLVSMVTPATGVARERLIPIYITDSTNFSQKQFNVGMVPHQQYETSEKGHVYPLEFPQFSVDLASSPSDFVKSEISDDTDEEFEDYDEPVGTFYGGEFDASDEGDREGRSEHLSNIENIDLEYPNIEHTSNPEVNGLEGNESRNDSSKGGCSETTLDVHTKQPSTEPEARKSSINTLKRPRTDKTIEELDVFIAAWRPKLECVVCHDTSTTFSLLIEHFNTKHLTQQCLVECCQHKFYRRRELEKHIEYHIATSPFKCSICFKVYTNKRYLLNHMSKYHSEKSMESTKCEYCSMSFRNDATLQSHLKYRCKKRPAVIL